MTIDQLQHTIHKYKAPFFQYWWLLLLSAILFGGLMWAYSHTKETLYTASTSFLPEKGKNQSVSLDPLANLLGGGGIQGSGGEEISGVLSSRYLSEKVAADSLVYRGEQVLMADALLNYYMVERFNWKNLVKGKPDISAIPYPQKIISAGKMVRSGLRISVDKYSFLLMSFTFGEPELVEEVSKLAIDELKSYLVKKRTEKDSLDYRFYQEKSDSVRTLVEANARFIARFADKAVFGVRAIDRLEAQKREIENGSLIQVLKQYELSREKAISQIQQNTPTIQILDKPEPPFRKLEASKLTYLVVGMVLGILLMYLWVSRKIWRADLRILLEKALA